MHRLRIRSLETQARPEASLLNHLLDHIRILQYELTDHIVDFFYVSSYGAYYDPYGFSVVLNPNDPSEDYDSGYWFSVMVYARYVTEASIVLGEDMDAGTDTWGYNFQGPNVETLMYQAFIPPDWIVGPACCQLSD
jgi:hypothetical protein